MFKRIPWKTPLPKTVQAPAASLVWIALGTNIGTAGQRRRILLLAMKSLERLAATQIYAVSSLYETPPWGVTDQPDFYNLVLAAKTSLPPQALLLRLKQIEQHLGRKARQRYGPREIDLDILLFQDAKLHSPRLTIPHPRMTERQFVMKPLEELWPGPRVVIPPIPAAWRSPQF